MTTEDKMPIDDRFKYLHRVKRRYVQADRKERGRLLDEMEAVTGLHRKRLNHTRLPRLSSCIIMIRMALGQACGSTCVYAPRGRVPGRYEYGRGTSLLLAIS